MTGSSPHDGAEVNTLSLWSTIASIMLVTGVCNALKKIEVDRQECIIDEVSKKSGEVIFNRRGARKTIN